MPYRGKVKNGVVVLEEPDALPEGAEVIIRLATKRSPAKSPKRKKKVRPGIAKFAGEGTDLPPDAARNLDHYLYGHPKR
jgi:hypothetical protein